MDNEFHKYDMHLYRDSFQNYKVYQIPKAQLIIADVPYNLGTNAYGSNPSWYVDGDNKNGESDKAQNMAASVGSSGKREGLEKLYFNGTMDDYKRLMGAEYRPLDEGKQIDIFEGVA